MRMLQLVIERSDGVIGTMSKYKYNNYGHFEEQNDSY